MTDDKKIKRFAMSVAKKGETSFVIAKQCQEKFADGKFKVVDGNIFKETDTTLNLVLTNTYIKGKQNGSQSK